MNNQRFEIREGERLDDLQLASLFILQKKDGFCFGLDAVALADFARVKPRERVADLGTGTGVLPLLLYGREKTAIFDAVELQKDMADMAARSVAGNGLEKSIRIIWGDLRDTRLLPAGAYSIVLCNPPYERLDGGTESPDAARRDATCETTCTLRQATAAARRLLRFGGRFTLCLPASRLFEALNVFKGERLEPKRLRFIHSKPSRPAYLLLLEGVYQAHPGLTVLPPLFVKTEAGEDTPEIRTMYHLTETTTPC